MLLILGVVVVMAGMEARGLTDTSHPLVRSVLDQHYIPVTLSGKVEVDFGVALYLFQREDILCKVQEEYARQLPPGELPEFVVEHQPPDRWSYVNRKNQPSEITEISRSMDEAGQLDVLYHVSGRRFFGEFESLVYVRVVSDAEGASTSYDVQVYAYPKVAVSRFFARHLNLIERYFRGKTTEVTELTVTICRGIVGEVDEST